jgi:hypothetical protein
MTKKEEVIELMENAQICGDPTKVLEFLIEEIKILPPVPNNFNEGYLYKRFKMIVDLGLFSWEGNYEKE